MAPQFGTGQPNAARKLRQISMPPVYRPGRRREEASEPDRTPAIEQRHVGDGFVVEIRGPEPEPAGAAVDLRELHYLARVMPRPGGADVPGGIQVANDMVFVPAGHSCQRRSAKSRGRHLCLLLQADFVAGILPLEAAPRSLSPRTDLASDRLRQLLDSIAAELEAPGLASAMLVRALCMAAVIELGRCLVAEDAAHPAGGAEQRVVDLVRSHLQSGLDQPLSLDMLAMECGIGVRHLSRIFRRATGMSIGHCLAMARIEHAKRLLSGTSVMIKEVSWRCGFREQAAFTTAFRKATGQSPSAFRGARID